MVRRKAKKEQEQDSVIIGDNPKQRTHIFKMQTKQKGQETKKGKKQHTALGVPR